MRIPLKDYLALEGVTQYALARAVGVTQSAISQMVEKGRNVFVIADGGVLRLEEVRRLGKETVG
jgi:plasmid maintenance system antidote protein VapI